MKINNKFSWLPILLVASACGGDTSGPSVPSTYTFSSRFDSGASSVGYAGQSARHLLIADMKARISQLQAATASSPWTDAGGAPEPTSATALYDILNGYYRNGADGAASVEAQTILLTTTPARVQTTYAEVSTGRRLSDKIAGKDGTGNPEDPYYVDFETSFIGFTPSATFDGPQGAAPVTGWNPTALVDALMAGVSANAYAARQGTTRQVASAGATIDLPIFVDTRGRDYQQLLEKFLIGAVAYSQLADDYLDTGVATGGLNLDNTQDGTNPYSKLEHAWDEGFGYFGASRDYGTLADTVIAGRVSDADESGTLDLRSEYSFGWSQNAAVRDTGACSASPVDFSGTIMTAFLEGRHLIAQAGETLTPDERAALITHRNTIVSTFEQVIAASAIHYINELEVDYANAAGLDFLDAAKHWSEMKGFLLALQFNPRSPYAHTALAANADFVALHMLVGDGPELDPAQFSAYVDDLGAARDALAAKYGFASTNVVGGVSGCTGW